MQTAANYDDHALAKSSVGISSPDGLKAHKSPVTNAAFFVRNICTHSRIMAGRVGLPSGRPVSLGPGTANPARSASISRLAALRGGLKTDLRGLVMPTNNKTEKHPTLAEQLRISHIMSNYYDKSVVLHDLADLLKDCLDEECEQPAELPKKHLVSIANAIQCVNECMDRSVENLIDAADALNQ